MLLVALVCAWGPASAQGARRAASDVTAAIRAYEELEYARAIQLLRHLLATDPGALTADARSEAETYLGAAEILSGRADSGARVFARLLHRDPRVRPDALVFPPEVTSVFEGVRREVRAVVAVVPEQAVVAGPDTAWPILMIASAPHTVRAVIRTEDGTVARVLYTGLMGDSLLLSWDGLDTAGVAVSSGSYRLVVASLDARATTEREYHLPFQLHARPADTLQHPSPPVPRPERGAVGPTVEALVGGFGGALALWLGPQLVADDAATAPTRLVLAGVVSVTGLVGALLQRPGRPIPNHVVWNREAAAQWQRRVEAITRLNAERRRHARLHLRAGTAVVVQGVQP